MENILILASLAFMITDIYLNSWKYPENHFSKTITKNIIIVVSFIALPLSLLCFGLVMTDYAEQSEADISEIVTALVLYAGAYCCFLILLDFEEERKQRRFALISVAVVVTIYCSAVKMNPSELQLSRISEFERTVKLSLTDAEKAYFEKEYNGGKVFPRGIFLREHSLGERDIAGCRNKLDSQECIEFAKKVQQRIKSEFSAINNDKDNRKSESENLQKALNVIDPKRDGE